MKLLALSLFIVTLSNLPTKGESDISITLTKTECGSYEVKKNGELCGYVVNPFYVEVGNKEWYIIQFEKTIGNTYAVYYDKFYRTYWFTRNSASDTLLLVETLPPAKFGTIPNWRCEEQEVDVYNRLYKNSRAHPHSFVYNCSKRRFKVMGDPD